MKQKLNFKKIALYTSILLVLIQLIRIDKSNKELTPENDFINITKPDAELASILKASCYDCHSNEITYPWYTNIAPVSWWIKHHINEGSEHLNFSEWGTYSAKKADHKLEECVEMVSEGEMPMWSYTLMHSNAKLDQTQKEKLIAFFNSLRINKSEEAENEDEH
ncbi:MAG: heme-binding domain-containing protein [Sphingobacteriaceae bacterium]|jgi:hypothetical protein